ncbi:elongation factor Ts [Spirochaetia bacterium]|nr:elongation factor Ts [Spirochaetia bacterium]
MAITAADVKKLRDLTGVGPAECKNVLTETNGDIDKAVKVLKEKGLAAAEKRSDRATNQGRVSVKVADGKAVLVEIDTETDFVARNPDFIALGDKIAGIALAEGLSEPNEELHGMVKDLATKIRENMSLKSIKTVKAPAGAHIASYIHGDGAIGVVVCVSADKPDAFNSEDAQKFVFSLAMHVAAFNPAAISADGLDAVKLKEQEEIFRKQMETDEKLKEKPANVLEGILKGKINKYISDICFVDQAYIKNDKIKVGQALAETGKTLGAKLKIESFCLLKVGG